MRLFRTACMSLLVFTCGNINNQVSAQTKKATKKEAYLFVYFTGNSRADESMHFGLSWDGYHYKALNHNLPIIDSKSISYSGGIRDPHILRKADGSGFYMVATDMTSDKGWNSNRGLVLFSSKNLTDWTSNYVHFPTKYQGQDSLLRVWAPQVIYDPGVKKYMVYFSLKYGKKPDLFYYAYANKNFTDLAMQPKMFFATPDSASTIDGDIIYHNGYYNLFMKTEDAKIKGLKIARSKKLTSGYVLEDKYVQPTKDAVEGSSVFPLNDGSGYILMYDLYMAGKYQFTYSKDLKEFTVVDKNVSMDFHPRHGTVLPITKVEADRLIKKWGDVSFYELENKK